MAKTISDFNALRQTGIRLSGAQEVQVKGFVKANNLVAAQRIILMELTRQFNNKAISTDEAD